VKNGYFIEEMSFTDSVFMNIYMTHTLGAGRVRPVN
jgi:hypothetical protein